MHNATNLPPSVIPWAGIDNNKSLSQSPLCPHGKGSRAQPKQIRYAEFSRKALVTPRRRSTAAAKRRSVNVTTSVSGVTHVRHDRQKRGSTTFPEQGITCLERQWAIQRSAQLASQRIAPGIGAPAGLLSMRVLYSIMRISSRRVAAEFEVREDWVGSRK